MFRKILPETYLKPMNKEELITFGDHKPPDPGLGIFKDSLTLRNRAAFLHNMGSYFWKN